MAWRILCGIPTAAPSDWIPGSTSWSPAICCHHRVPRPAAAGARAPTCQAPPNTVLFCWASSWGQVSSTAGWKGKLVISVLALRVLLSLLVSPMALVAKVAPPGSALTAGRAPPGSAWTPAHSDVACAALLTGAGGGTRRRCLSGPWSSWSFPRWELSTTVSCSINLGWGEVLTCRPWAWSHVHL